MRFEVPQFIEVKEKIFGPLGLDQFIYLVGGGGLAYICLKFIPVIGFVFSIAVVVLALLMSFYEYNGRTFLQMAQAWVIYQFNPKLYLWNKQYLKSRIPKKEEKYIKIEEKATPNQDVITSTKIKDIATSLDILDKRSN